ncbi:hypothetical protein SH580_06585 [Coraliomargarita algicola]|uniref:Hemolytic protein HlpA-like protein n=1 Tax=Coraliomargarita algicola TaxID=3092156 RepID=A0ABZ0RQ55_9BACT|nr:hypothetical protein [Coraliomargarita sp. J2-16]WPJ97374.1 hypothetical protein SH580_06585 [Coraliomargarita sp. J2-16]
MNTPTLIIIFNRPQKTRTLIDALRPVRPNRIYVAADGPRPDREGEAALCEETRAIIDTIDWPCEIFKDYSKENMGCGPRPATAISWVFEHEESAIILEDDCIPDPSLFPYCSELLEKYKSDSQIMQICGTNHIDNLQIEESYFYTHYISCWGWATWRRAWQHFDYDMTDCKEEPVTELLQGIFNDIPSIKFWKNTLLKTQEGDDSVWDYRWQYAVWKKQGLCIIPRVNLVSNIGFGLDSTHTFDIKNPDNSKKINTIKQPLIHPASKSQNLTYNSERQKSFNERSLWKHLKKQLKKIIPAQVIKRYQIRKYGQTFD